MFLIQFLIQVYMVWMLYFFLSNKAYLKGIYHSFAPKSPCLNQM